MAYDDCPLCGIKMTGFATLFCPKEDEHGDIDRIKAAIRRYQDKPLGKITVIKYPPAPDE